MARGAIFLDRDGTLNCDRGYTHKISEWQWLPGALAAIAAFNQAGWPVVVVSNQSGIARGLYTRAQLAELETWVNNDLAARGLTISGWYYCPHGPNDNCDCRKPKPGLILNACADLDLDASLSWMIGDRLSDIQAGYAAGCDCALVLNPAYPDEADKALKFYPGLVVGSNLAEVAREIVKTAQDHEA